MKIQINIFEFFLFSTNIKASKEQSKNSLEKEKLLKELEKNMKRNRTLFEEHSQTLLENFVEVYNAREMVTLFNCEPIKNKFLKLCSYKLEQSLAVEGKPIERIIQENSSEWNKAYRETFCGLGMSAKMIFEIFDNFRFSFEKYLFHIEKYLIIEKKIACIPTSSMPAIKVDEKDVGSIIQQIDALKLGLKDFGYTCSYFIASSNNLNNLIREIQDFFENISKGEEYDLDWRWYKNEFEGVFSDQILHFVKDIKLVIEKFESISKKSYDFFKEIKTIEMPEAAGINSLISIFSEKRLGLSGIINNDQSSFGKDYEIAEKKAKELSLSCSSSYTGHTNTFDSIENDSLRNQLQSSIFN